MSDRYMVAVAFQEKFVDFIWCSNWSSKSLIMFSLWIASISDGVKSIEELYDRYGITEDYSERKEVIEEVITWPEHLIVVDLDKRDVYFNAECSVPYDAVQYQNWPIANKRHIIKLVLDPDPYHYGWGSELCSNHRMPFDEFNQELLIKYCKDYCGWTLRSNEPNIHEDDLSTEETEVFGFSNDDDYNDLIPVEDW